MEIWHITKSNIHIDLPNENGEDRDEWIDKKITLPYDKPSTFKQMVNVVKPINLGLISMFTNYVRMYKKNREIQNGGFIARIQRKA